MQSVGRLQTEATAKLGGLEIDRLRHAKRNKFVEQFGVALLEDEVAALDWPHQAFAFDQRRDGKIRPV